MKVLIVKNVTNNLLFAIVRPIDTLIISKIHLNSLPPR